MKFLDISLHNDQMHLKMLTEDDKDLNVVYYWFSKLLWFNPKKNVDFELNLPIITAEINRMSFSELEKYFYDKLMKNTRIHLIQYLGY